MSHPPSLQPILTTRDLSFAGIRYPDIAFQRQEINVICGPSGCGKSTLLRLCNRTLVPATGQICLDGQDIRACDPLQLRRNVLLAGQEVFLFEGSIADNFRQFYALRELPEPPQSGMRRFLDLCACPLSTDSPCGALSGGERQRVFLAVCLSFVPRVLLLDEPTSALDGDTARRFMTNLRDFAAQHGMSVILVSHDRELAARFAGNLLELA